MKFSTAIGALSSNSSMTSRSSSAGSISIGPLSDQSKSSAYSSNTRCFSPPPSSAISLLLKPYRRSVASTNAAARAYFARWESRSMSRNTREFGIVAAGRLGVP